MTQATAKWCQGCGAPYTLRQSPFCGPCRDQWRTAIKPQRDREYYQRHREHILARAKAYAAAHREAVRTYKKRYVERHRPQRLAWEQVYKQRPDVIAKRRAYDRHRRGVIQ